MVVQWSIAGVVLLLLVVVLLFAVVVLARLSRMLMRRPEPELETVTNDDFPFVTVVAVNPLLPMLDDAVCERIDQLNISDDERRALKHDFMGIALAYGAGCAARAISDN